MNYRLSETADGDIDSILNLTLRDFGQRQVHIYADLIDRALDLVAEDPYRRSSVDRSTFLSGLRSFHIGLASARRSSASHILFYLAPDANRATPEVQIVRVLHQAMDPAAHIAAGLRSLPD